MHASLLLEELLAPKNYHRPQNTHAEYVGFGPWDLDMRLNWNVVTVSLPWAFSFDVHFSPLRSANGFWWLYEYAL